MNYIGSKILETENLILRPTEEDDLKTLWKILCNYEVAKYYLVGKIHYDWKNEKVWQYKKLEKALSNDAFQWSIVLKEKNKCIGQISCQKSYNEFNEPNPDDIRDVGWFLNTKYQGKGYGTEASKAVINYMFNQVNITKIDTCAAKENIASWKLMEKLEFIKTKNIRQIKYTLLSSLTDCYCYVMTKEEFTKKKKQH